MKVMQQPVSFTVFRSPFSHIISFIPILWILTRLQNVYG